MMNKDTESKSLQLMSLWNAWCVRLGLILLMMAAYQGSEQANDTLAAPVNITPLTLFFAGIVLLLLARIRTK